MTDGLICDASVMVALLTSTSAVEPIARRLRGSVVHVPAHFDAEVLSALGRLHRSGAITAEDVTRYLERLAAAPYERHALAPLLAAAWQRRGNVRLVDALYLALSDQLGMPILTLDRGMAASAPRAELVEV